MITALVLGVFVTAPVTVAWQFGPCVRFKKR